MAEFILVFKPKHEDVFFFFPRVLVNILPFPWENQTPGIYNILISIEFSDTKNKQLLVTPSMNNTGRKQKLD